jgi:hypothetical protein
MVIALAHLAWFQNQRKPKWMKYLGAKVINDFKDGVRFLFKTGESGFRPPRRIGSFRRPQE